MNAPFKPTVEFIKEFTEECQFDIDNNPALLDRYSPAARCHRAIRDTVILIAIESIAIREACSERQKRNQREYVFGFAVGLIFACIVCWLVQEGPIK